MNISEIESRVRGEMINSLALKHVEFLDTDDDLELDSLSMTQLKIFLESEFKISIEEKDLPNSALESLMTLTEHIAEEINNEG